jgi:hypothetical protein
MFHVWFPKSIWLWVHKQSWKKDHIKTQPDNSNVMPGRDAQEEINVTEIWTLH